MLVNKSVKFKQMNKYLYLLESAGNLLQLILQVTDVGHCTLFTRKVMYGS